MTRIKRPPIGEAELAALNAKSAALLADADDAWDDAVRAATAECAILCESLRARASGDAE